MKKTTLLAINIVTATLMSSSLFAQDATFDFSNSNNYVLIYLDEETSSQIPNNHLVTDYRVDDVNHALWIWDNTYTSNPAIGPNSNGVPGAFLDFSVGNAGWSGFGFSAIETGAGKDMTKITDNHYMHIALKSSDKDALILGVSGGKGEAKLNFSDGPYNDSGAIIDAYDNFERDGEWYSFDIPVSDLKKLGATYEDKRFKGNALFALSGGRTGANICLDAIFYHTKGTSNINEAISNTNKMIISKEYINVIGSESGITIYSLTGCTVKSTQRNIIGITDLKEGIYIVKSGNVINKVHIK